MTITLSMRFPDILEESGLLCAVPWSNLVNKTENASKSSRDIWEHLQHPLCFDMPNLIGTLSTMYLLQQILKKATFGIQQCYLDQFHIKGYFFHSSFAPCT